MSTLQKYSTLFRSLASFFSALVQIIVDAFFSIKWKKYHSSDTFFPFSIFLRQQLP